MPKIFGKPEYPRQILLLSLGKIFFVSSRPQSHLQHALNIFTSELSEDLLAVFVFLLFLFESFCYSIKFVINQDSFEGFVLKFKKNYILDTYICHTFI